MMSTYVLPTGWNAATTLINHTAGTIIISGAMGGTRIYRNIEVPQGMALGITHTSVFRHNLYPVPQSH